jgi:hypothetical protein
MNFNLLSVVLLSAGAVLMWSAVNNQDPRDVIKNALSGKLPPAKEGFGKKPVKGDGDTSGRPPVVSV